MTTQIIEEQDPMADTHPLVTHATYDPDDNKLRIYASGRYERDDWLKLRELGFIAAPIQGCFFAVWTYSRLQLCLDWAGEVVREGSTIEERAEARAIRFDKYAMNRMTDSNAYLRAAQSYADSANQPILAGHHSQRKMEAAEKRRKSAEANAIRMADTCNYWLQRATGVERHVNRNQRDDVVGRRVETILKELRKDMRWINHANWQAERWAKIADDEREMIGERSYGDFVIALSGIWYENGPALPRGFTYDKVKSEVNTKYRGRNEISENVCQPIAEAWQDIAASSKYSETIKHYLNRLSYERAKLGDVPRFDGNLTAAIIQTFARKYGAKKVKASKTDDGYWELTSPVRLPVYFGTSEKYLNLEPDEWKDLMQDLGYTVPTKAPAKPPIINCVVPGRRVTLKVWGSEQELPQIDMTQAEYMSVHSDQRGVKPHPSGTFRMKICKDPAATGPSWNAAWVVPFITDKKVHDVPEVLTNESNE